MTAADFTIWHAQALVFGGAFGLWAVLRFVGEVLNHFFPNEPETDEDPADAR